MRPDYQALRSELAKPEYTGLSDADAASLLNAPGALAAGTVPPAALLKWGAKTGARASIEARINDANVGAICLTIRDLLTTGTVGVDTSDADVVAMLGALVATGTFSTAQRDSLLALGQSPGPSVATLVFGVPVSPNDVSHARAL